MSATADFRALQLGHGLIILLEVRDLRRAFSKLPHEQRSKEG